MRLLAAIGSSLFLFAVAACQRDQGADASPDDSVHDPERFAKELATSMIQAVDTRLAGTETEARHAMPLFMDVRDKGESGAFTPNPNFWAKDLRSQLTGVHMHAGGWGMSYGLQAVTPRHAISCAHNGPDVGNMVRYVNVDGEVFETKILGWMNDFRNNHHARNGDQAAVPDLSLYLLADELPAWVYLAPVISFTPEQCRIFQTMDVPLVALSQGFDGVNNRVGRKLYVRPWENRWPMTPLRAPFWHDTYVGDSGTPQFVLLKDRLYLYAITVASGHSSGIPVAPHVGYLNELIARADAAASIRTEYKISLVPMER
jgi:hypothetical protein